MRFQVEAGLRSRGLRRRVWAAPALVLALTGSLACEPAVRAPAPARAEPVRGRAERPAPSAAAAYEPGARARVSYPRGACTTAWIEVQVFEPDGGWVPHPEHPRIRAGGIHAEEAHRLLDLRVRCIDPAGKRPPSEWVRGVDLERMPAGSDGSSASP